MRGEIWCVAAVVHVIFKAECSQEFGSDRLDDINPNICDICFFCRNLINVLGWRVGMSKEEISLKVGDILLQPQANMDLSLKIKDF